MAGEHDVDFPIFFETQLKKIEEKIVELERKLN